MNKVREERSGWRDEALSHRHRQWGWDCPMVDVDFLCIEYTAAIPKAIVEYKKVGAIEFSPKSASYLALRRTGDMARLPVFVVRYDGDLSEFFVAPINAFADAIVREPTVMDEAEYVIFLYGLRGAAVPDAVLSDIRRRKAAALD